MRCKYPLSKWYFAAFVQLLEASTCQDTADQCHIGSDAISLLQSVRVHVDILSDDIVADIGAVEGRPGPSAEVKDTEEVSFFSAPLVKLNRTLSKSSMHQSKYSLSRLAGGLGARIHSYSLGELTLVLLVLIFVLLCMVLVYLHIARQNQAALLQSSSRSPRHLQRPLAHSAQDPIIRSLNQSSMFASAWPAGQSISALSAAQLSAGQVSATCEQASTCDTTSQGLQSPQPTREPTLQLLSMPPMSRQTPPALCPTLVMPVCEARFGVPLSELSQFGTQGQIVIVGLSGNPLLRAVVRLQGLGQRTLEICMPEKKSAARAMVSPTSRAGCYEICGMKGDFYGFLQIQSSGACSVIKDGQTVLMLDGDNQSLDLTIRSGGDTHLASVGCSSEPFGGVEHVEVRVEPGVDTVLILAVVLGVLLLCER